MMEEINRLPREQVGTWLGRVWRRRFQLSEMLSQATPEEAQRITAAFLNMKKLDLRALEAARRG